MKITDHLFEAFLKCPTKCWLRATNETPSDNAYAEWVKTQNESYRVAQTKRLSAQTPPADFEFSPPADNLKAAKWRLAADIAVTPSDLPRSRQRQEAYSSVAQPTTLNPQPSDQSHVTFAAKAKDQADSTPTTFTAETRLHAAERVPPEGRGKAAQFIPIRFIFTNKLGKDDRLLLAFDAFVLSAALRHEIAVGKIIHGDDHATLKVKTAALASQVRKFLDKIAAQLFSPTPPDLILNRHCAECEFQARCRQKAMEKDDLSLLAGMSEKERKKLRGKGIFTVTQLSYTFRPRRRPKRQRDKREKYHHSLKALAIREKKIHIVGSPELKIEGTPVYLDVEGLPDRDFYYLIGVRIGNGESAVQHSLWADTVEDEGKIWRNFLDILQTVEKPVLIHYGSYETDFTKRMCARYGSPHQNSPESKTIGSMLNLLSFTYAQIYFPGFSNSLKDAAGFLGFIWIDANFLGVQSIAWRRRWEESHDPTVQAKLVNYNEQDCKALELVAQALSTALTQKLPGLWEMGLKLDIAKADDLPSLYKQTWKRFTSPVAAFEAINKTAQWNYQRDRIYVRTDKRFRVAASKREPHTKRPMTINSDIVCERPRRCPRCGRKVTTPIYTRTKVLLDIRFIRFGLRRWVVRYQYTCLYCRFCHLSFGRPREFWHCTQYGRNLVALLTFRIIELCDSQTSLAHDMNRFFGFSLVKPEINRLKATAAKFYTETREAILKAILKGTLVHVDETGVLLHRKRGYVWVLTTLREVVFFYSDSREGDFILELLDGFQGVLVSDFYAAYDSIQCPQQKCLIHLMRDLNDALMECPYDEEVRLIVTSFGDLLRGIVDTIDRRGLKCYFLRKHNADVERFYRQVIKRDYHSDAALKCKERFEKNRDRLFTFLNFDGVPWNNNNAEHAIKAFASLRRKIGAMSTAKGIDEYLILLSVCQTCKYMGVDFLDFLRSGEKDIHAFAESRRGRTRRGHRPSLS